MERISVIYGNQPVVLVAPHAYPGDDYNTDIITETIADNIKASAIINHGWQKSDKVDFEKDLANCNNVEHMIDVVKDEFLDPLLRLVKKTQATHNSVLVVFIHGVSNHIRKIAGTHDIDMVLGHGAGHPKPSYTCSSGLKDFIIFDLQRNGIMCFEGKPQGKYSAFLKNNMNQYWRKHQQDLSVESFQLEIIRELREDKTISILTADYLSETLLDAVNKKYWKKPTAFQCKLV